MSDNTFPIIGQLVSIAVQSAAACFMFYLMGDMKYSFYNAIVNKCRYFYYKRCKTPILRLFCSKDTTIVTMSKDDLDAYNAPFKWLKENPVYTWYMIKGWSTFGIVFGLLHQLGLNQIYTKPKEFFISSPLSGLSFVFILMHLITIIRDQKTIIMQHRLSKSFSDKGIK